MVDWTQAATRARERYEDGAARLPEEPDERQRQLTRMGNASWAAGLSLLMLGDRDAARQWLVRAAETYRDSWADAPPGSWGRPIGAMKSRLVAEDATGAREDARWALDAGAAESESPIGRYAAALAQLVLEEDDAAAASATKLGDGAPFPPGVVGSVAALSACDGERYEIAVKSLLADFEARDEFLEDIPVADTVLALQVLARARGIAVGLRSGLLPD